MNTPFFSIIIPLYNKEKYIKRALYSVLNQKFKNYEIIVINDGSTDRSLSVVQSIKDNRIKIYNQKNLGLNNARNAGITKATGKYISFLDADDEYRPNFLNKMYDLINKYKGYSFFATAFRRVDKNNLQHDTVLGKKRDFIVKDFLGHIAETGKFFIHVSSIVVKRIVFKKIGMFYVKSKKRNCGTEIVGDFDLWIRIAMKYKLVYSNYVGCIYYKNTPINMLSGYGNKKMNNSFFEDTINNIIKKTRTITEKNKLQKILYSFFNLMAVQSLIRNNIKEAKLYLNKQIKKTKEVKQIYELILKKEIENNLLQNVKKNINN